MVETFVSELLHALADVTLIETVAYQTEGGIAKGRAYFTLSQDLFLEFYFNKVTGTLAFALIRDRIRIWGIDCDTIRGWHKHPLDQPEHHIATEELSVVDIVGQLNEVLDTLAKHQ